MMKYLKITSLIMLLGQCSLLISCGESLDLSSEYSLTQEYKVFGIRAEPPVIRPDDQVILTAYDHHPKLKDVAYSWSICLYSHGAAAQFECLKDDLFLKLREGDNKARVVVDFSAKNYDLRARLKALGQDLDREGKRRDLSEGLDIFVILKSGTSQNLIRTVKRIKVIDRDGEEPLARNPELEGWTVAESEIVNKRDACKVKPLGPESSLVYNELGEVINGTLRDLVIDEVRGKIISADSEELEDPESCVFHNKALLSVELEPKGDYEESGTIQEGYTYRWYASLDGQVLTPITIGGPSTGRYEANIQGRKLELFFTVRDPNGGFTMGRQLLNLIPGIADR
jgi:hypothetical protein